MKFKSDAQRKAVHANINAGRTQGAINRDLSIRATNTLPNTPENVKEWQQDPRRIDIEGIDTPIVRDLPKKDVVKKVDKMHPYLETIQGKTIDELQYIYGEQRHEFDTNLANLSEAERKDLKLRIELTKIQIQYRKQWKDQDGEIITSSDNLSMKNAMRITTDMYKRDLENGNLTQAQYNKLIADGTILSKKEYEKALKVKGYVDEERYKPQPQPEHVPSKYKVKELESDVPEHVYKINDVVMLPSGTLGSIKNIKGDFISIMDASGNPISSKLSVVKLIKSAPDTKAKDDWQDKFNHEQTKIAELTKGNIDLLGKKGMTDRFMRAVNEGTLTQTRYDEMVASGELLTKHEHEKATSINKAIQKVKDTPFYPPEQMRDSSTKNAADLLKWEAAHPPKELLPPKEYTKEDTKNFVWGVSEAEAINKFEQLEITRQKKNVKYFEDLKERYDPLSKKWTALSRTERKAPENQDLRYKYYSTKKDIDKYQTTYNMWLNSLKRAESGDYVKVNKSSLKRKYVDEVKKAIKTGKPVPFDVIKQYPEFTKAQNSRERYNKGRHTSFDNVSIAVDESKKEMHGVKIKLQNGKDMTEKRADEIISSLSQYQSAVGNITNIMRKENLTVSHTSDKHPFLSTAAGLYHPDNKTVTMGMHGVAAHELTHFIDETAKEHKDAPKYDYDLLAKAKLEWNGGAKQAISLSKRKSKEQLTEARALRVHIGSYWERPEEIFARLGEQYTAYKNKSLSKDEQYYSTLG